MEGVSTKDVDI